MKLGWYNRSVVNHGRCGSIILPCGAIAKRGRGTARRAVEGARSGLNVAVAIVAEFGNAPTTMFRMVPPPRTKKCGGGCKSRHARHMRLSSVVTAVVALIVLALGIVSSRAQGFSGLGADAGGFAQVVRGKPLVFPADHGAHPDYRIEWWYVTANLKDAQGNSYGVQWTLFRQALAPADRGEGWASQQIWMGHAARHQRECASLRRAFRPRRRRPGRRRSSALQRLDRQLADAEPGD